MNERRTSPAETQPLMTSPFNDPTRNKKDARRRIALSGWQVWALLGVLSLIAVAALMWFLLPKEEWKTLKVDNVPPGNQKQGIPTEDGKVLLPYRKSLPEELALTGQKSDSPYGQAEIAKATKPTSPKPSPTPGLPSEMVLVKGATFMMGRNNSSDPFEKPAHSFTVDSFLIDKTEVTNEDYQKFLNASLNWPAPPDWGNRQFPTGKEKYPVTNVTWDDAREYAKWAEKRLPTEAEWEFAARGADGRLYPWVGGWQPEKSNVGTKQLAPVGQYSGDVSPFGVFDMAGNVSEWTIDALKPYPGGRLNLPPGYNDNYRNPKIVRGGHFMNTKDTATTTYRGYYPATRQDWSKTDEITYATIGFRCAKDAPQQ